MTPAVLSILVASLQEPQQPVAGALMQSNKPPVTGLTLPPLGAELGIFGKWERGELAPGKEPVLNAKPNDVQIKQFTVTHIENDNGARGRLQVDVILDKAARDCYADVYVSGYYVGVNGEIEGIKNVGRRPAYEFARIDYVDNNKHPGKEPNRRTMFQMPNVLPVKVRVELYQMVVGKSARLVATKETAFDNEWKDYGVIQGYLFGEANKTLSKASFLVQPGTASVTVRVPALHRIKPDDYSNDLSITVRANGETQLQEALNRNIEGREFNWKATVITASPWMQDRDVRNSEYWPYLKGAGYLEIPPIRAGYSGLVPYP